MLMNVKLSSDSLHVGRHGGFTETESGGGVAVRDGGKTGAPDKRKCVCMTFRGVSMTTTAGLKPHARIFC